MSETPPIDSSREQLVSQPDAELKRMRLLATGLLVLMTGVFAVTTALAASWPFLTYPRAFAEVAMVGACADWFAVVALFRHPFGIPIPHTAIVPRHKKCIGDALGQFISVNFLAPDEVAAKLEKIGAAGLISSWLKEPENTRLAARRLHGLLPPLLEFVRQEQIRTFSRGGIDSIAAAPLVARVLPVLIKPRHGFRRGDRDYADVSARPSKEHPAKGSQAQHFMASELGRREAGRCFRGRTTGYPRCGTRFGRSSATPVSGSFKSAGHPLGQGPGAVRSRRKAQGRRPRQFRGRRATLIG